MSDLPIYFDYMATTPVDPRVVEKMLGYLGPDGIFGNASSSHAYGRMAASAIETARAQIAESLHAAPEELVFTSGATEAINLALVGAAKFYQRQGKHLITMTTEHKAVLDSFRHLEAQGFQVTYLNPESDGLLNLEHLIQALRKDTILVSILHVNNEIGVIQDLGAIGEVLRGKGIIFHVDAAQSGGKLPISVQSLPVDLLSLSAHKTYGPKGVGALYIRHKPRIRIVPQSYGGGHQGGLRAGTLATHQIVGMGEAFAIAEALRVEEQARILVLRQQLWNGISDLPGIQLNGHPTQRLAGNLNFSLHRIASEALFTALHALAISSTSACIAASTQPSYVLRALGLSAELAYSSVRLSLGRFTTETEVARAIIIIRHAVGTLLNLKTQ